MDVRFLPQFRKAAQARRKGLWKVWIPLYCENCARKHDHNSLSRFCWEGRLKGSRKRGVRAVLGNHNFAQPPYNPWPSAWPADLVCHLPISPPWTWWVQPLWESSVSGHEMWSNEYWCLVDFPNHEMKCGTLCSESRLISWVDYHGFSVWNVVSFQHFPWFFRG